MSAPDFENNEVPDEPNSNGSTPDSNISSNVPFNWVDEASYANIAGFESSEFTVHPDGKPDSVSSIVPGNVGNAENVEEKGNVISQADLFDDDPVNTATAPKFSNNPFAKMGLVGGVTLAVFGAGGLFLSSVMSSPTKVPVVASSPTPTPTKTSEAAPDDDRVGKLKTQLALAKQESQIKSMEATNSPKTTISQVPVHAASRTAPSTPSKASTVSVASSNVSSANSSPPRYSGYTPPLWRVAPEVTRVARVVPPPRTRTSVAVRPTVATSVPGSIASLPVSAIDPTSQWQAMSKLGSYGSTNSARTLPTQTSASVLSATTVSNTASIPVATSVAMVRETPGVVVMPRAVPVVSKGVPFPQQGIPVPNTQTPSAVLASESGKVPSAVLASESGIPLSARVISTHSAPTSDVQTSSAVLASRSGTPLSASVVSSPSPEASGVSNGAYASPVGGVSSQPPQVSPVPINPSQPPQVSPASINSSEEQALLSNLPPSVPAENPPTNTSPSFTPQVNPQEEQSLLQGTQQLASYSQPVSASQSQLNPQANPALSESSRCLSVGAQAGAKLLSDVTWSNGLSQGAIQQAVGTLPSGNSSDSQQFIVQLTQPLTDSNGNVTVPSGSQLVASLDKVSPSGMAAVKVSRLLVDGQEYVLPEGAISFRSKDGRALMASKMGRDDSGVISRTAAGIALNSASQVLNASSSQANPIILSSGVPGSPTVFSIPSTQPNSSIVGSIVGGVASEVQRRNAAATQAALASPDVWQIAAGTDIQIVVNRSFEL